jgi:VCBS repeat-containing protein
MPGVNCRKRFDRERNNFFHYVLFAHSRGIPKSTDPASPDFHVPSSSGGRGDLPYGGDAVVTLGWWDNFVGTDLNQASTLAHELGHNLGLWHGGPPMQITEVGTSPNTRANVYIESNCKSNYLSLMNYAFGFTGLLDDDGIPHVDFSGGKIDDVDETLLRDGALAGTTSLYTPQYRTAWFVPTLSTNPAKAKRFCGDKHFPDPLPAGWTDMVRVDAQTVAESIDWNRNGSTVDSNFSQDINFSGDLSGLFAAPPTPTFHGYNDWASVRLDQVGSRGNQAGFSSAGGDLDFVGGDLDFVGGDLDFVGGDLDFVGGDLDFVGGDLDFVGGDLDFVGGDVEPTFAAAAAMGYASPNTFKACIVGTGGVDCLTPAPLLPPTLLKHRTRSAWKVPVVGSDKVTSYTGYRALGSAFNPATAVQVGTPSSATNQVDNEELPDGVLNNIKFTYSVTATFVDGTVSAYSASRSATITPVNDPPVAVPDSYTMLWNGTLNVTGSGVLANDTDDDSPATSLRAVLNAGPSHGTLTLRPDGSFTYKPDKNFVGTDTFSYKANDGVWFRDSTKVMSPNSNTVTVTIVVSKK